MVDGFGTTVLSLDKQITCTEAFGIDASLIPQVFNSWFTATAVEVNVDFIAPWTAICKVLLSLASYPPATPAVQVTEVVPAANACKVTFWGMFQALGSVLEGLKVKALGFG